MNKNQNRFTQIVFTEKNGLFYALRWLASALSKDDPYISGVYVTRNYAGELQLVGTDGCRIHILTFKNDSYPQLVDLRNGMIGVKSTENEVAFTHLFDRYRCIEYEKLIPKKKKVQFKIKLCKATNYAEALFYLYRAGSMINPAHIADLDIPAENYSGEWTVAIDNPARAVEFKSRMPCNGLEMYALIMPLEGSIDVSVAHAFYCSR